MATNVRVPNGMKKCRKCNRVKLLLDFSKNRSSADGHQAYCKECNKKIQEKYQKELKEARAIARGVAEQEQQKDYIEVNFIPEEGLPEVDETIEQVKTICRPYGIADPASITVHYSLVPLRLEVEDRGGDSITFENPSARDVKVKDIDWESLTR